MADELAALCDQDLSVAPIVDVCKLESFHVFKGDQPIPDVLHVPYTYFPDAPGGTEVYVRALAQQLAARGYPSAVAAPGAAPASYVDGGLSVYRFRCETRRRLELAYGVPDEIAAE